MNTIHYTDDDSDLMYTCTCMSTPGHCIVQWLNLILKYGDNVEYFHCSQVMMLIVTLYTGLRNIFVVCILNIKIF